MIKPFTLFFCLGILFGAPLMGQTVTASFSAPAPTLCSRDTLFLTNTSTGALTYEWWVDGSLVSTAVDLNWVPTGAGMPLIELVALGANASDTAAATFNVLPIPVVTGGPNQSICPDSAPGVLIGATITGAPGPYTYQWSPSAGLNDSTILNAFARPDSTTTYTLTAISGGGCPSQPDSNSTVTVFVQDLPIALAGNDTALCDADTIQLNATALGGGPQFFYNWFPAIGLSNPSIPNPRAYPNQTTTYALTVFSNGCPSFSDSITIHVLNQPGPSANFALSNPAPQVYQFQDASAGSPVKWYWELNCPALSAPVVNTAATWTDTLSACDFEVCLTVTDTVGCGDRLCDSLSVPVGVDPGADIPLVVYPNPARRWLQVEVQRGIAGEMCWEMVDGLGKRVLEGREMANAGEPLRLDLTGLDAGMYWLRLEAEGKWVSRAVWVAP